MNSIFNINVCRVCMQNNQSCDLWKDKDLLEKFIFTTRLQVVKEDNLPKHICSKCTTRLKVAFTFIKMAHASDNNLKKFLEKINSEFKEVTLGNKGDKKFPNEQIFSEDDLLSLMDEDITGVEVNNNDDVGKSKDVEIDKCKDEPSYNFSNDFLLIHATTEIDSEYENSSHFMEIPTQEEEEIEHYNEVDEDNKLENNEKDQCVNLLDCNEEADVGCQTSELRTDETDANHEHDTIINSQDDTIQYQSVYVEESSGEEANLKDCGNNNIENFDEVDEMHENVQKKYDLNEFQEAEAEANTVYKKETFLHRFYCKKCNRDFSTKTNLNRHMQSHEGNKPFSCTECKKSFTQKSTLKQHMYTHTGERPYVCEVCSRGFTQCKSLIFHMRRHTGEKPFHCEYCLITFRQKDALRIHILKHHVVIERTMYGTELFSCIICQKKFETKPEFKTHMKVHTATSEIENTIEILQNEEKTMKLKKNIDAATSSDSECLKAAVVNVSASSASEPRRAKKFQCRKCFKCFALKKSLVRHMRIHYIKHDGDLTECLDCDLQFSSADIYQEHLSLCHQYTCSACPNLVFKTIQQLKVHIFEHELDQQEQNFI